jgi:aspartate kinase
MKVFKFGGASVKDAAGVRNLSNIVRLYHDKIVIVVSAMGKTTNALEIVARYYFNGQPEAANEGLEKLRLSHLKIVDELFPSDEATIRKEILDDFKTMTKRLKTKPSLDYDFEYDQIVSLGEVISTRIVAAYLNHIGSACLWVDARQFIRTDDQWREATIDWQLTNEQMPRILTFKNVDIYLTQGFIGATSINLTTTLGREGSDFTAAIIANVMNAESVTIWKDVPGIMNADPNKYSDTQKLDKLSYREAVEMTYYGAKVIHPKTMKPLVEKDIPLYVRSFIEPNEAGSVICNIDHTMEYIPVYINKEEQVLITISPLDFSFIAEESISNVYHLLSRYRMKVNLVQQSAMNFSVAIDKPERNFEKLIDDLKTQFTTHYKDGLELLTIRSYTDDAIRESTKNRTVYVEQRTRRIVRFLLK